MLVALGADEGVGDITWLLEEDGVVCVVGTKTGALGLKLKGAMLTFSNIEDALDCSRVQNGVLYSRSWSRCVSNKGRGRNCCRV